MACRLKSLYSYKPGVGKVWLYFSAGLVWLGVGVMLIGFASRWLKLVSSPTLTSCVILGTVLATCIYFFGFSRLAKENTRRIDSIAEERISVSYTHLTLPTNREV